MDHRRTSLFPEDPGHEGGHAGVDLADLGLKEEQVPDAVRLHACTHHPGRGFARSHCVKAAGGVLFEGKMVLDWYWGYWVLPLPGPK